MAVYHDGRGLNLSNASDRGTKSTDTPFWLALVRLSKQRIVQNVVILYVVHGLVFIIPVTTTPFLARVLGPSEWGAYAIAQSLALWSSMVVEYGFILTATRDV